MLLGDTAMSRIAGVLRTEQNWIGGNDYNPCGADFVPPPPEEVAALLEDLCTAMGEESLPPVVQAALIHAQFETIHPFEDGNGRTGRALVHVVLRRRGVAPRFIPPISVAFARAPGRYIAGLTAFRADGVAEWIEQFATAMIEAARTAQEYLRDVQALQEEWRERLRLSGKAPRVDATAWEIINLMPAHPVISVTAMSAGTGRSTSSIYEAIDLLVDVGVLVPTSQGKRRRAWEGAGLLDLIERAEEA
jgi:Fic family protein